MCTESTSVAGSSLLLPHPITDIETVISEKEKRLQREERLEELLVSMKREIRQLKEDKEFLSNKFDQVTEGYKKLSGLYQQQGWLLQEEKRKNAALKQENEVLLHYVTAQQRENVDLQTKAIDLEKSREHLTKAIALLEADNHTLTNERENAQKSVNELKQELQLLQENHQQLESEYHKEKEEWQKTMRKQEDLMREKDEVEVKVKEFEQSWKITHKDVVVSNQELGRGGWGAVRVGVFRERG